ncbi:MAG TPA: phosphodiester glycosidase family protein [Chitinophagaceae bacterium]|jgi:exopolysaccharide biosynthesis protein|nr:phosphodiester glycosidase family protein [Chitinophagaceae bacterium]
MLRSLLNTPVLLIGAILFSADSSAQLQWQNVDSLFGPLPASVHVYKTTSLLDGKPNIAYYVEADLKNKKLDFIADTSSNRRLTPTKFYEKNYYPLVVVNTTFFSFETNRSLNVVVKDNKLVAWNPDRARKSKADSTIRIPVYASAIGISKRRKADVVWTRTDSINRMVEASQIPEPGSRMARRRTNRSTDSVTARERPRDFLPWKVQSAVGGGPVLLQDGEIKITNNEEMKFAGKAIDDKHPRTAMGYTKNNKLILLVIEGRHPGQAEGATLTQEAQIFKDLGCVEALNLDGGGSSCMLVNGKETIKVSDAAGQRPVPAVFIIRNK